MHQRHEGERLRGLAHRMLGQDGGQSHRLVAKLPADGRLLPRGEVALREQHVEDLMYGRDSR